MPSSAKTKQVNKIPGTSMANTRHCIQVFFNCQEIFHKLQKKERTASFWSTDSKKWCDITFHLFKKSILRWHCCNHNPQLSPAHVKTRALFHFQMSRKDYKNYNLLWQTGSQSKQVPPTFKATNSCPPTTLPKTSKQSCSGPRHS